MEGLAKNGKLNPVQQAVLDHHALQCGFCTPGFLMSAKALLDKKPNPTRDEIKTAIAGNLSAAPATSSWWRPLRTRPKSIRKANLTEKRGEIDV